MLVLLLVVSSAGVNSLAFLVVGISSEFPGLLIYLYCTLHGHTAMPGIELVYKSGAIRLSALSCSEPCILLANGMQ